MDEKLNKLFDAASTNLKQLCVLLDGLKVLDTASTGWPGVAQALIDVNHAHGEPAQYVPQCLEPQEPRGPPPRRGGRPPR